MDAAITNASSEYIFIPGPNLDIPPGETKSWSDITVSDLDSNTVLKSAVVNGDLTVVLTPDTNDAAQFDGSTGQISSIMPGFLPTYTVAELAGLTGVPGRMAFATDGRAGAEGAAAGTGTMVVYSNGDWRRVEDLAVVAA